MQSLKSHNNTIESGRKRAAPSLLCFFLPVMASVMPPELRALLEAARKHTVEIDYPMSGDGGTDNSNEERIQCVSACDHEFPPYAEG